MLQPTFITLPAVIAVRRDPPRPPEFRDANYAAQFDDSTLVFDVARPVANSVVLIAPPLRNLEPLLEQVLIDGIPASRGEIVHHDRISEVWLHNVSAEASISGSMEVSGDLSTADSNRLFAGKRVLYTLSKDNKIEWISRWIAFNAANHGADAVLLYDNNSTSYTVAELQSRLRAAFPNLTIHVVNWPFKYGPQGSASGRWDSDFAQHGAFHSARYRFLQNAKSVLNTDIDELIVSSTGASIFAATEAMEGGYIPVSGPYVLPLDKQSDNHFDALYLEKAPKNLQFKWCATPRRCPTENQWRTHIVLNQPSVGAQGFELRHYLLVTNNWKWKRTSLTVELEDTPDPMLVNAVAKARNFDASAGEVNSDPNAHSILRKMADLIGRIGTSIQGS